MCFYPDGRFHCFGCGADGDAADLYAALHNVPLAEALRFCRGESYTPKPITAAENIRQKVERWYSAEWSASCREKHTATAAGDVARLAAAEDRLNHLDSVKDDPIGKTMLFKEATSARSRTA